MAGLTRTVAIDVDDEQEPAKRAFRWPWQLVAAFGALAVAGAGWVVLGGVSAVVWLASSEAPLADALRIATQFFGLTHGAATDFAGQEITLIPLGLTMLLIFLARPIAAAAARHAASEAGVEDEEGLIHVDLERVVLLVAVLFTAVYAGSVALLVGAVLGWESAPHALLGGVIVGAVSSLWGAAHGTGFDPTASWPAWLRVVPRAMGVALCTLLAAGAAALALALIVGRDRIATIVESLEPGIVGTIALIVLHLIYLPNLVLWACSWLLGAGITIGDGSLLTLTISDVGLLPAIPVLGAVPEPGVANPALLAWLAGGVVAGALAGLAVTWARPRARFDETALVGGLSGVLAGLAISLLASWASGGLGSDRLEHIGARVDQLLIFAPTLLGIAGMIAGLVLGLVRRPAPPVAEPSNESPEAT